MEELSSRHYVPADQTVDMMVWWVEIVKDSCVISAGRGLVVIGACGRALVPLRVSMSSGYVRLQTPRADRCRAAWARRRPRPSHPPPDRQFRPMRQPAEEGAFGASPPCSQVADRPGESRLIPDVAVNVKVFSLGQRKNVDRPGHVPETLAKECPEGGRLVGIDRPQDHQARTGRPDRFH